jgi:hypothetical protein
MRVKAFRVLSIWKMSTFFYASIEPKERGMRDLLVGLLFIAMVMAPCVAALTVKLDDGSSK